MNFQCAYYSLNIGALHESDITLKTEGLKSLNIKSSSLVCLSVCRMQL